MSIDRNFCISSFLAFRYIEDKNKNFADGITHRNIAPIPHYEKYLVNTADDIDEKIAEQIRQFDGKKKGILLSGGMDSAIVASYLKGCDAYTFRFLGGDYQKEELNRAEYYARYYGLKLHYVDITWNTVEAHLNPCIISKGAPVHSIEPQILQAAKQAQNDGIEIMFIGNGSDYVFGGMDGLLSKDWTFDEFVKRYTYIDPETVLIEPVSMRYLFERYRTGENEIDFIKFLDDVSVEESYSSYHNAFLTAGMPYFDPYVRLKMASSLDLDRIRNGESKYLIRELMKKKYPDIPVPNKLPMPRPVDAYFADWTGPTRPEFKKNLDMKAFSGNQKWQLWCLERFLNMLEK